MKIYSMANTVLLAAAATNAPLVFAQKTGKSVSLRGDATQSPEDASAIRGEPGLVAIADDSGAKKFVQGITPLGISPDDCHLLLQSRSDYYCWSVKLYSNDATYAGTDTGLKFYLNPQPYAPRRTIHEEEEWYMDKVEFSSVYYDKGEWGHHDVSDSDGNFFRSDNGSAYISEFDTEHIGIVICADGDNGFYLDRMELFSIGSAAHLNVWKKKQTWGVENDKGYCISTQSTDSTYGSGSCDSGAHKCIRFNGDGTVDRGVDEPDRCLCTDPEQPCATEPELPCED